MTAAKAAKEAGLKSLKQASEISGFSPRTLENYFKGQPQKFKVIILGCVEFLATKKNKDVICNNCGGKNWSGSCNKCIPY